MFIELPISQPNFQFANAACSNGFLNHLLSAQKD